MAAESPGTDAAADSTNAPAAHVPSRTTVARPSNATNCGQPTSAATTMKARPATASGPARLPGTTSASQMPPMPASVSNVPPACSERAAKAVTPSGSLVSPAVPTSAGTTHGSCSSPAPPAPVAAVLRNSDHTSGDECDQPARRRDRCGNSPEQQWAQPTFSPSHPGGVSDDPGQRRV